MSFSGFLDNQAGAGRGISAGPSTGMGEAIGASFDFTWKAHTTAAAIQYQGEPLNQRNDLIKTRFGQDVYDVTKIREKYPNPSADGRVKMAQEANDQIDTWILKGRTEAPDKYDGIKTTKEIRDEARKTVDISENHMNEIMVRNPSDLSRMTGGFIGGMGAAMLDPPNLLTLPFGAGEVKAGLKGWAAARGVMKAAAIDGTINAAIEASSQPAIMEWQKTLGRRYGFGDAAENVALAFAGGTALSGLIRGLSRGASYAGSVSSDVLDRIASNEKLPASVRDAAAFMSRRAHIDESAPPEMIKTGEDLRAFRETADELKQEFESYSAPSAATSSGASLSASSEKGSEGLKDAGTQALPSHSTPTDEPSPFVTPKTLPSNLKANKILGTIDATSQSMIYHSTKKVDNLLKKAGELLPALENLTDRLSSAIDGLEKYPSRVKTKESLSAKIAKKKRGPETMPDILGGRLVADTPEAVKAALDQLQATTRILEIDDKMDRGFGYRGVHVVIASDKGISAEIQIQPREIREVQDEAHEKYYKKWDDYEGDLEKIKADNRIAEYVSDMEAQEKLFADAWAKWEDRTGNGTEDISDLAPAERVQPLTVGEDVRIDEVNPDRIARAESDLKEMVEEVGEETFALDDGRVVSMKDFAEEIQAKKAIIEAMKTCRIA